ncbi:beta-galactosidase [Burkholderia vietnamiensis]|uniref:Beta-galactosidase n=1 Tax=Burkholderia vietnamiensis (strain G4 / LMG 22486) TaxID=269482 RepID=A4JDE1_BURVG|nr:Beta-galactosidase [Burkholderia vietnamiensis G4]MCB4347421.1 beta-galactosidase [Burkholderia vietnamiensis]
MKRREFILAAALTPLLGACSRDLAAKRFQPRSIAAGPTPNDGSKHTLTFGEDGITFLLDGKPYQIRSGEMHPPRIPRDYWRHRIQMAKAMGMNTIAVYVMWNFHETSEGTFEFDTDERDVEAFIRLCQDEGMWVLLRPGPYICGEWDLGGLPAYLLAHDDIQLRVSSHRDRRYMDAAKRYIAELVPRIKPLMSKNGGPILMLQIENEYATYGNDVAYLEEIREAWVQGGIPGPFFTDDGVKQLQESRTALEGCAIALSGPKAHDVAKICETFPGSTVMGGELYPGFFTHWGDREFQGAKSDISRELTDFMRYGISFSIYVIHGGTNFGYSAGANLDSKTGEYQPDITSYDYNAPIDEQGRATENFSKYRTIIQARLDTPLPDAPAAPPALDLSGDYALRPYVHSSVWDNLPSPIVAGDDVPLKSMEHHGQASGFILYRKPNMPGIGGALTLRDVHDYATVFANGSYIGGVSRAKMPRYLAEGLGLVMNDGQLSVGTETSTLDVLVEAMGRVNYGDDMIDRKGITDAAHLDGKELRGWQTYCLSMSTEYVAALRPICTDPRRPGLFFKASMMLNEVGDTFLDMRHWIKGVVWVNGRNIGRYWNVGPQFRLFCPAPWLRKGYNEVTIFDLHQIDPMPIDLRSTAT